MVLLDSRRSGPAGGAASAAPRVGLDLGGTKVHGVLLDGAGEVRAEVRVPTVTGADGVVASAERAVRGLVDAAPGVGPIGSVGLALPGLVDPARGTVSHAVNLGITGPAAVGPRLGARLGVPVTVENDLNAAALGAAALLGLRGDLAFLALGTGVAAGLVLDGRVRRGYRGAAGEVGHLPLGSDGAVCGCGQTGCLELRASGAAIDAAWPGGPGPAPQALFAAAADGDARAVVVRDAYADAVAAAVWTLVLTVDVEHVVLGGGVAAVGPALTDAVAAALERRAARSPFLRELAVPQRLRLVPPDSRVAPLGAAAAAIGVPLPLEPAREA